MPVPDCGPPTGKTVLVIERDASVRTLLKTVLGPCGFTVLEGGGVHAMEICRALGRRVDVILTEEPVAFNGIPVVRLPKPFTLPDLVASLDTAIESGGGDNT